MNLAHITPARAKELKSEVNHLEKMLNSEVGDRHIGDKAEFQTEIRKKKAELRDFSPRPYKGALANKRYAQAKKLKEIIQKAMPSNRDYFRHYPKEKDKDGNSIVPEHNTKQDFDRAVEQQVFFQTNPKIQQAVRYYKHIMAKIDPNDPSVRNIETLRR